MSLDSTKLGQVTAALMESLDDVEFDAEIGEVMVLAEVKVTDEDGGWGYIAWRCSDERDWIQRGLMHAALDQEREIDDDDDDEDDE